MSGLVHHCNRSAKAGQYGRTHTPVDDIADDTTSKQAADNGKRERRSWQAETDATNVHHSLKAFTEHSDKRKEKHGILLGPFLEASIPGAFGSIFGLGRKSLLQLNPPLVLELVDAQERCTHDGNDYSGNDAKSAWRKRLIGRSRVA